MTIGAGELVRCQCAVVNPRREPVCPLPATQEDFLCDHCRAGHPESGQAAYDLQVDHHYAQAQAFLRAVANLP